MAEIIGTSASSDELQARFEQWLSRLHKVRRLGAVEYDPIAASLVAAMEEIGKLLDERHGGQRKHLD